LSVAGDSPPTANPAAVTSSPAAMSVTKWLPVATTASETSGAHVQATSFQRRRVATAPSTMLTASAKPAWRLGTAAYSLYIDVVSLESSATPVWVVIVSTRPMSASRGGATGNSA
jgi:hypothetical protein